ncbi:hypothetical protein AU374_05914 [Cupriavidus metallidurans]|jgi:hypothetical protein|nr:hypothetical protein AU374_05914 [Cupriavidus metallidurans]
MDAPRRHTYKVATKVRAWGPLPTVTAGIISKSAMTIYAKKLTSEQSAWLEQYEKETGFEPMYQEDIDSGDKTFLEAAKANVRWFEEWSSDAHLRIAANIPGALDALMAGVAQAR